MAIVGRLAPAFAWRAFFIFNLVVAAAFAAAPATAPDLAQVGKPDAAESKRILEQFRRSGIAGQFYLEFELRALPRRGDEQIFQGRLWGGRNEQGQITRVELTDAGGARHRFLLQNGERAAVWNFSGGRIGQLGVAALFAPLIPGVELTAFDLQMPFLYWPDAVLEKVARARGRPAYVFLFRPPAAFALQHPELAAARADLDTQSNQLLQMELIGRDGRLEKTLQLGNLMKIGEQWLPKSFDVRNELTRDKTRFQITGAALNLDFAARIFEPAVLAEDVRPPAAERIVRVAP